MIDNREGSGIGSAFRRKKIWKRNFVITLEDCGKGVDVHVGNGFRSIFISEDMVGCKFGQLAFTRKYVRKWEKGWRISCSMVRKSKRKLSILKQREKVKGMQTRVIIAKK